MCSSHPVLTLKLNLVWLCTTFKAEDEQFPAIICFRISIYIMYIFNLLSWYTSLCLNSMKVMLVNIIIKDICHHWIVNTFGVSYSLIRPLRKRTIKIFSALITVGGSFQVGTCTGTNQNVVAVYFATSGFWMKANEFEAAH